MAPKISRKVLASLQKPEKKLKLETSEEYLEQGTIDEESGDRWLGSDLAKSLRFYQKAYDSYIIASTKPIEDARLKLDIYYNISRLLLHVYNQYFQTDGVDVKDLANVDEVTLSPQSVIQDLRVIVQYHEQAIDLAGQLGLDPSVDLLYNTGIVYTQVIEEAGNTGVNSSEIIQLGLKTQQVFSKVLDVQVSQLQSFSRDLDSIGQEQDPETESSDQQTAVGEEVVQPPDVFETVLTCFRLCHSLLQTVDDPSKLLSFGDLVTPFTIKCDAIATELIGSFAETNNSKTDYLSSITAPQLQEYELAKILIEGLLSNELDEIITIWSKAPEVPEKYLQTSDNIQEFLDRNDITVTSCHNSNDTEMINGLWKSLTLMTNNLKRAQEMLSETRQQLSKRGGDNLGTFLAQISKIITERSDIDLQRCQLNHEQAVKGKQILFQNCKVFLKNAMNTANMSGGLRERVVEKKTRNQRKIEAVLRLSILEGKTSTQELDDILGRQNWMRELPNLIKLEYFNDFGIDQITF